MIQYNTIRYNTIQYDAIRVVESKSLKVGKSLKIEKKLDKIGKIGFDFLLDFF